MTTPQPQLGAPVEYDENGVPYYRWPPFPEPPPGVTIVPFKDFKPSGIQIAMDPDERELDGLGIPTVQLKVKHDNTGVPKKKKKVVNGIVRRNVWWEDWAEGEDLRSAHHYDHMLPRADRLIQASHDFKAGRHWPPITTGLSALYDQFRLYIGLIGNHTRFYRKHQGGEDDDEEDDLSDDDFARGAPEPRQTLVGIEEVDEEAAKVPTEERDKDAEYQRRTERMLEAKEARMEAFLNDPELSMKIFFSSYFRDKGLLWATSKLRDAPYLVSFFLNFLRRNRALPESHRALMRAIEVVERAKIELPVTKRMSLALPDELAEACTSLWGSRLKAVPWSGRRPSEDGARNAGEAAQRDAKKPKLHAVTEGWGASGEDTQFEDALKATGVQFVKVDVGSAVADMDLNVNGLPWEPPAVPSESSRGAPATVAPGSAWGASPPLTEPVDDGSLWGGAAHGADFSGNPWAMEEEEWPAPPVHSLMALLGPTMLPLTHTTGAAELSTRMIVGWTPPPAGAAGGVRARCAAVALAPWGKWSADERAAIREPELLPAPAESREDVRGEGEGGGEGEVKAPPHDPNKDNITLLVDPKILEHLHRGMGIGGTFVQVVPRPETDAAGGGARTGGSGRGRGRGGRGRGRGGHASGKLGDDASEQTWWYLEQLKQVLPSFWTERG